MVLYTISYIFILNVKQVCFQWVVGEFLIVRRADASTLVWRHVMVLVEEGQVEYLQLIEPSVVLCQLWSRTGWGEINTEGEAYKYTGWSKGTTYIAYSLWDKTRNFSCFDDGHPNEQSLQFLQKQWNFHLREVIVMERLKVDIKI